MTYTDNTKAKCVVCRENIAFDANKCIHCDSYQDWRRHLRISSTTIALLAALISVTALSAKHISALFKRDYSEIGAIAVEAKPGHVLIIVANSGNTSGALLQSQLEVTGLRGQLSFKMTPKPSSLVEAGQVKEIRLTFAALLPDPEVIDGLKGSGDLDYLECSLELSLLQFQSMSETFSKQKKDMETLGRERELRRSQEGVMSESIVVPKYSASSRDSIFLDIDCGDLFPG